MAASTDSTLLDNLSKKPDVLQEEFGSDGEVSKVRRKGPVDSFRHRKLLDAIGSLGGKKKVTPRTEPSLTVSEYDLSKASVEKVAVHQLLMNLKKTEAHRQIKKKVRSIVRNAKVLAEPLHGPQQQRARRQVAYEKVGEEVSVWEPVVRQNRVAEQLRFPLNQPSLKMESAGKFTERFKPRTELEREINKILKVSENVTPPGAELTPAEEKALKAMSLEEAKERLAELKKMRALLSYQEMKARRQGKIKSKKYHRILKKERLKREMKEFEELKEKDPELAIEKLKELEKQRILERVSLRHRGTGKWAKQQMLRTKYNQESREALLKQLELSRQLTQKPLVESSDDEGAMDSAAAQEVAAAHTGELEARFFSSANPWLKNPARSRPHTSADNADEDNDAATLDTVPEDIGSVQSAEAVVAVSGKEADDKSGNVQPVEPVNSMEGQEECLTTVETMTEASSNMQPVEPVDSTKSEEECLITAEAVAEASSCATNDKKEKGAGLSKPKRGDQVKLGSVKKGAKRKLALVKKNRGVGSAQASKAVKASREEDVNIDRMFDSLDDHDMKKRKEAMTEASINVQPAEPVNNTKSAEEGLITAEAVTEASSCATNGKKEKNAGLTKPKRDDQVKLGSVKKGAKRKLALIKKNRGVGSAQASKAVKASLEEDFNIDRMFDSLDDHNMKKRKKIKPGQKGKNQKVKKFAARKEQKETSKKENKNSDGRTTMEGLESTEYEAQLDETLERKQTLKDMESFSQDNAAESAQKPRCSLVPQPVESEANPDKVEVDPTKFLEVKQQILKSRAPDLGGTAEDALDDEDMEKEQAVTIAEAFADDDVISAFREEKKAQVKQDTPQGVDLFLPGWGSWGGSGIKVDRKKRRRFLVKPPPAPPRKDQTLGNVIISEAKDEKLEAHQVSALPFPFNNVSQFESVISHPVGSLWNPETSFRELTAPKVVAKIGQVIDPMDRDALIVKKKENVVDKLLEQKKAETKHNQQPRRWRKKK